MINRGLISICEPAMTETLLLAATAIRLKLTVLHEDGDFETVTRFVPELQQRRVSAGPK